MHAPSVETLTCFFEVTFEDSSCILVTAASTIYDKRGGCFMTLMTTDELRAFLMSVRRFEEKDVQNGHHFRCDSGEVL